MGKISGSRDRSTDLRAVIICKFQIIRSVFKIHIFLLSYITSLFKKLEQNPLARLYMYTPARKLSYNVIKGTGHILSL